MNKVKVLNVVVIAILMLTVMSFATVSKANDGDFSELVNHLNSEASNTNKNTNTNTNKNTNTNVTNKNVNTNTNINTNKNVNTNTNTNVNTNTDTLPDTGLEDHIWLIALVVVAAGVALFAYSRVKYYKEV